jgi:hypothetical protein
MKFLFSLLILMPMMTFAHEKSSDRKPKVENKMPDTAKVFFVNLKEGQVVPTKFKVQMGLEGTKLRNASEDIEDKTTGHHHILVNHKPIPAGEAVPADETHIHYGKSQTEAELTLKPGAYSLTLQLADGAHRSYGEKLSATINIVVK